MNKKILFCATVDYHFKAFHLPYLKWFKDQGWNVHIAASGEIELPFVDQKFNIPIQRSPFHLKNFEAYNELKTIIRQNQYQIIHCHTPMGGVLGRLAAQHSRKKGTTVLYTAHGFHFCKGAPLQNWIIYYPIEKWLAHYTDSLITINSEDYLLAKQNLKARNIEHVHGVGVNTDHFKPMDESNKRMIRKSFGYKPDDFLLFYAAEFNKNKNHQLLLKAVSLIKEEIPNAKLLLAGEGPLLETCKQLASKLKIENMVDFLGFRNDIDKLAPICDVAVASSLREGLPVNIMEAMACGLPVVATENRGHKELVRNDENGFIINQKDDTNFAKSILKLYKYRKLSRDMGMKGLKNVRKFSVSHVTLELNSIYSRYMLEDSNEPKSKYYRSYL